MAVDFISILKGSILMFFYAKVTLQGKRQYNLYSHRRENDSRKTLRKKVDISKEEKRLTSSRSVNRSLIICDSIAFNLIGFLWKMKTWLLM